MMEGSFISFVWAAGLATVLTFYGVLYVFECAASRGLRAGLFAGFGLSLGLLVFGSFPIVQTGMNLLQLTQYYQYVRIVVVVLALIIAVFIFFDFRVDAVMDSPRFWVYIRVFFLGFLMNIITPLPLDFYNHLLTSGGVLTTAGAVIGRLLEVENPFDNPLRAFTLPVISFLVYWLFSILGQWAHRSVKINDAWRFGLLVIGLMVFLGVAVYVGLKGVTYEPSLIDKLTDFGLNRLAQ